MKNTIRISLLIAVILSMGCGKQKEPIEKWVDLSEWKEVMYHYSSGQGPGQWVLSNENQWATQTINCDPIILVSDIDIKNGKIEGSWLMTARGDDDLVGFVFAYQDPGHFYLLDWKKATQNTPENGLAKQGVSIKAVAVDYSGPKSGLLEINQPFDGTDLWNTEGTEDRVTLLYHEETAGWEFEKEYGFILEFDPGAFTITIQEGEKTLFSKKIEDSTYKKGKFGFYNFSQAPVIYKGFKTIIPPKAFPWWIIIVVLVVLIIGYVVYRKVAK